MISALRKVNICKLVDFIPSLDTIVPMLRSFKGMVDFDATAEAVLDSNLNVKIPSLSGHAYQRRQSGTDGWRNLCGNIQDTDVQEQETECVR